MPSLRSSCHFSRTRRKVYINTFKLSTCIVEGSLAEKHRFLSLLSLQVPFFEEVTHKSFVFELSSPSLKDVSQKGLVFKLSACFWEVKSRRCFFKFPTCIFE